MEYVVVSSLLFCIGLFGVVSRRNAIATLMALELMLNAVNLNLVYFSFQHNDVAGQIFTLIVIAVAAAEVTIGLAVVINIYRKFKGVDLERISLLKW